MDITIKLQIMYLKPELESAYIMPYLFPPPSTCEYNSLKNLSVLNRYLILDPVVSWVGFCASLMSLCHKQSSHKQSRE